MQRIVLLGTLGVYWLALFIGTHMPQGIQGLDNINDKLLHFAAYAGLAFLLAVTLTTVRLRHGALLLPMLIAAVYGCVDEVSQSAVPGRHADVADWAADVFGAGLGVIVFSLLSLALVKYFAPLRPPNAKLSPNRQLDGRPQFIKTVLYLLKKDSFVATYAVILPAAGKSSRFHDKHYKKPFIALGERAVWLHAADKFLNRDDVKQVLLIISPEDREDFHMRFGANVAIMGVDVVEGGAERSDSVRNALALVRDDIDFVAVHDAARPCIANEWIDAVFTAAQETGAAILGIPVSSTLKRVAKDQTIEATVPRTDLWEAQTPQVFRRDWLVEAYSQADQAPATDDAELVQRLGHAVKIVPGSPINLKITTKDDLRLATQAIKALPKPKLQGPAHPFAGDDMWR